MLEMFGQVSASSACILANAHTCINGCTGSGKSVLLNRFLFDLITTTTPQEAQLYIIDPKQVDYIEYEGVKHLQRRATTQEEWTDLLVNAVEEMHRRYKHLQRKKLKKWSGSHIFIIIDELPEVLKSKTCMQLIDELLRLGRAARIHVITASQDSSRSTGTPAALARNFTCFIGLHCRDKIASRQAIGCPGCELLPLYGYAYIYTPSDLQPQLYKIDMITEEEIKSLA